MIAIDKFIGITEANIVADYILKLYGPMSHLKLQKLLFYCQAYHLGYFELPLFDEDFEAWVHGPVCRDVYDQLKGDSILYSDIKFEGNTNPEKIIKEVLNSDQIQLISDVLSELSTWTGFELEAATHKEHPWIEARRGYSPAEKCNVIISKESMMHYYKAEING